MINEMAEEDTDVMAIKSCMAELFAESWKEQEEEVDDVDEESRHSIIVLIAIEPYRAYLRPGWDEQESNHSYIVLCSPSKIGVKEALGCSVRDASL